MAINKSKANGFGGIADHHIIQSIDLTKDGNRIVIAMHHYANAVAFNDDKPPYPPEDLLKSDFGDLPASIMTKVVDLQSAIQEYLITLPIYSGGIIVNDNGSPA